MALLIIFAMSEPYNQATATHYASYRPPLHELILGLVLSREEGFDTGLDVGCGTGYSALALASYCAQVYGVDPSPSMLEQAAPDAKITYLMGQGADLPLPPQSVDIVTFAGSLFYAKSQLLIDELRRVCRPHTLIIPYDFEVVLEDVLRQCGLQIDTIASNYDHEINFSHSPDFIEDLVAQQQLALPLTTVELAHILLSDSDRYTAFAQQYGVADPFPPLVQFLEKRDAQHHLTVNIYFSKYRLNGLASSG